MAEDEELTGFANFEDNADGQFQNVGFDENNLAESTLSGLEQQPLQTQMMSQGRQSTGGRPSNGAWTYVEKSLDVEGIPPRDICKFCREYTLARSSKIIRWKSHFVNDCKMCPNEVKASYAEEVASKKRIISSIGINKKIKTSKKRMHHKHLCLLPPNWRKVITEWLQEDVPTFDYAGFVLAGDSPKTEKAILSCDENGILAGCVFFDEIFSQCNCNVFWLWEEGDELVIPPGQDSLPVAYVEGTPKNLLIGERTALNVLARASGIATRSRHAKNFRDHIKWHGCLVGTRKTTPGFRLVEKYALLIGGCDIYRMDLSSMIMLEDNHIWSHGNVTRAVHTAKEVGGFALKTEVECKKISEAREAIAAGANMILLDNFKPKDLKHFAEVLKKESPHIIIVTSGNISLENLSEYCSPCVDVISMSWLTEGVPQIEFSLKLTREEENDPEHIVVGNSDNFVDQ